MGLEFAESNLLIRIQIHFLLERNDRVRPSFVKKMREFLTQGTAPKIHIFTAFIRSDALTDTDSILSQFGCFLSFAGPILIDPFIFDSSRWRSF